MEPSNEGLDMGVPALLILFSQHNRQNSKVRMGSSLVGEIVLTYQVQDEVRFGDNQSTPRQTEREGCCEQPENLRRNLANVQHLKRRSHTDGFLYQGSPSYAVQGLERACAWEDDRRGSSGRCSSFAVFEPLGERHVNHLSSRVSAGSS